jgi:hypothetical protein
MAVKLGKNGKPEKQKAVYKPETRRSTMATNGIGKGTKTIGINMRMEMATELERRAKSMQLSTGAYCKIILHDWISSKKKLKLQES